MTVKKVQIAFENLDRAFASLVEFLAEPIVTRRDMAGVIQAFEYTYEQFWKVFKKVAEAEALEVASPRQAIQAAYQLGLIDPNLESDWADIIKTRNETSHTYNEDQAKRAVAKISGVFVTCFRDARKRLTDFTAKNLNALPSNQTP